MKPFPILHLSDAHLGKLDGDATTVLKPLLDKLKADSDELGAPKLIVFSGDIVFGQERNQPKPIADQFSQAGTFLDQVYKAVGATKDTVPLAIVPGNHDIDRDAIDEAQRDFYRNLTRQKVESIARVSTHWERHAAKQKAYADFVKGYVGANTWTWDERWLSWRGELSQDNIKVGVVGLNTSWTSYGNEDRNRLWVGDPQREMALNFGEGCDFRILITHHPTWWLHEDEQLLIQAQIESHFQLHLHGHEHFGWFSDPTRHLRVAAGACYQGSRLPCGYNWVVLDFESKQAQIHLREFVPTTREWVPRDLGTKAPHGIAIVDSPWRSRPGPNSKEIFGPDPVIPPQITDPTLFSSLSSGGEYCQVLQNHFLAEIGEPQIPAGLNLQQIYWPVRRRNPTIVHAAQAFIAAGLAAKGAKVSLWVDDVGKTSDSAQSDLLSKRLSRWFEKIPGAGALETRYIQELLADPRARATCETFRKWLSDHDGRSLQKVLEISKVIRSSSATLESVLKEQPSRLLNPPLVWTGLAETLRESKDSGFATISGIDEQELWRMWGVVYPQATKAVTHIYCAKLLNANGQPYDMDQAEWRGRDVIERELTQDLRRSESAEHFLRFEGMARWCFSHLIALPSYLSGRGVLLLVNGKAVKSWSDVKEDDAEFLPESLATGIAPWLS